MIPQLKDMLNKMILDIEMGHTPAAMNKIAQFTILFSHFLTVNEDYIFASEILHLNHCLGQMLKYVEEGDLGSLQEIITNSFISYLNNWDFKNKPVN